MLKKSKLTIIATGLLAASLSAASYAGPKSSGSHVGGTASEHLSAKGLANTNGPAAATREHGLTRATDRRSDSATTHAKTGQAKGKQKHDGSGQTTPTTTTTQP